ncbi:hypothetical protein [Nocardiopsis sp. CA-288880]|uniref:hypothetical protein n=1 Tax=Nocardiopsis sp. CA-288880 TaxID=3239995 RepID=UPI003D96F8D8
MARNYAQIKSEVWKDDHFKTRLDVDSQWMYFTLLSQPNLNGAGVLPLQDRRWKKLANGLTADRIESALEQLQAHWYVIVDEETEEVLIRTFIRNDGLWKQPNVLKSALGHANNTMSDALKAVIWHEVDRLPLDLLEAERAEKTRTLIGTLRPTLLGTLPEGFMEPPRKPSLSPFEVPEQGKRAEVIPITRTAQENTQVNDRQPMLPESLWEGFAEGFQKPFPKPSGVGAGVGEGAGVSLGEEEIPKTPSSARTSPKAENAGTLTGWWIDQCNVRPPKRTIGQMSKEIKGLLDEGFSPDLIRAGITAWMAKECGPSALAGFVNQAANTKPSVARRVVGGSRNDVPDNSYWDTVTDEDLRNSL